MAKKIRFNFIDVCIVVVLIAAVVILFGMYNSKTEETTVGHDGTLEYTVLVTDVDRSFVDAITNGDLVIFGSSSSDSANVVKTEAVPAIKHTKNLIDGGYENSVIEGRFDVSVTLSGTAVKGEESINIGTTKIRTGEIFEGKGKSAETGKAYLVKGYVIGMNMSE